MTISDFYGRGSTQPIGGDEKLPPSAKNIELLAVCVLAIADPLHECKAEWYLAPVQDKKADRISGC